MPNRAAHPAESPAADLPATAVNPASESVSEEPSRPREIGGPTGLEPTRYGDWEKKGRCIDF
jgi:hypothetical protein